MGNGEESPKSPKNILQDKDFILDCLCWHNEYRARHGASALTVSSEVNRKIIYSKVVVKLPDNW